MCERACLGATSREHGARAGSRNSVFRVLLRRGKAMGHSPQGEQSEGRGLRVCLLFKAVRWEP